MPPRRIDPLTGRRCGFCDKYLTTDVSLDNHELRCLTKVIEREMNSSVLPSRQDGWLLFDGGQGTNEQRPSFWISWKDGVLRSQPAGFVAQIRTASDEDIWEKILKDSYFAFTVILNVLSLRGLLSDQIHFEHL